MYHGSCLCQNVTFEIKGDFEKFYFCHCSRCRKKSGSAHGANLFSSTASFTWTKGGGQVKTYRHADTRFTTSFCNNCGSSLPTLHPKGMVVPAGSLDCDINTTPSGHIFTGSRANWDHALETVKQYEALPTS